MVLRGVSATVPVCYDSGGEIAEYPRAVRLDRVDISGREEKFTDGIASRVIIEEREESPVNQPCSVLKLCKRVVE